MLDHLSERFLVFVFRDAQGSKVYIVLKHSVLDVLAY